MIHTKTIIPAPKTVITDSGAMTAALPLTYSVEGFDYSETAEEIRTFADYCDRVMGVILTRAGEGDAAGTGAGIVISKSDDLPRMPIRSTHRRKTHRFSSVPMMRRHCPMHLQRFYNCLKRTETRLSALLSELRISPTHRGEG